MSDITFEQASDEIHTLAKAAWDPSGYELHYEGVRTEKPADADPWATITIRHVTGQQRTLGISNRLFERNGMVIFQIFIPSGNGLQVLYQLAKLFTDAFEGISSPSGVWFRNVRINEVGRDGQFHQLNVLVDFEYTEVK